MSGFAIFQKINRKLDEGWKMTNVECPICKTIILGHPTTKELYCVKCEMPVKLEKEEEEYEVEVVGSDPKSSPQEAPKQTVNDEDDFDNMVIQRQNELKRKKQDELSKKMGELLLQGWCMLEECCETCLFPLMRSKRGELICVGCGPIKSQEEKLAEQKKALEEEEKKKAEVKKEEIKPKAPVKELASVSDSDNSEEEVILSKTDKKNKPQAKKVQEESESSSSSDSSEDEKSKCKKIKQEKTKESNDKKEKKNKKIKDEKKKCSPCNKEKEEDQSCSNKNFNYNCEVGQFQESIDFYTKMTQALSEDFEKLSTIGLISNLDKVKAILKIQKKIDQNKLELIHKLNK